MKDNFLTDKEFWVNGSKNHVFQKHTEGHELNKFIKQFIPENFDAQCLEIGSYPGPHLSTFGDLGYTLNGIDFNPDNENALPTWLNSIGYKTGEFTSIDFFEVDPVKKFEVVASFGFVEHFVDYKDVILRHAKLVKYNGYLIITTPNFKGLIQHWLHKSFDKNNLALHNTESMNPLIWKNLLEQFGFEIIFHGYFGDFWFWHGHEKLPGWKRKILWIIERAIPRIRKILWFQSSAFSAYAGIVARKKII